MHGHMNVNKTRHYSGMDFRIKNMVPISLYFASSLSIEFLYDANNYWAGKGFTIMVRLFVLHGKATI